MKFLLNILIFNILLIQILSAPREGYKYGHRKGKSSKCNCVCGSNNRKTRVVGGDESHKYEFPWIAGLAKGDTFHCGATLITKKHILTAAHCVNNFHHNDLKIVLGDHDRASSDRSSSIVTRQVKSITEHEAFDAYSFNNDIAILELDEPVGLDDVVKIACLPKPESGDYAGKTAVVAGWGKVGEKGDISSVLRKLAVPVWSKKECYDSGYGERKISENMFCAGYKEGKKDACQGDSGGPLHMSTNAGKMEIIGVVSWGRGCARPNLPGIYTKVINYIDWIEEVVKDECLCHA